MPARSDLADLEPGLPVPVVPVEVALAEGLPEGAAHLEAEAERAEDKPVRSST